MPFRRAAPALDPRAPLQVRASPGLGALYAAVGAAALAATIAAQKPALWARWAAAPLASLAELDIFAVDWHAATHEPHPSALAPDPSSVPQR